MLLGRRVRTVSRTPARVFSVVARRRWYADETGDDATDSGSAEQAESASNENDPETLKKQLESLQARLKEVNDESAGRRHRINELEERLQSFQQAQKKKLEEEGNWRELARQREAELEAIKPYQERAEALEAILRQNNEARIAQLPETMRQIVPQGLTPEKLGEWLDTAAPILAKPVAPNIDAGAGSGSSGGSTPKLTPEEKAIAAKTGMSEADYAKWKEQSNTG